MVIGMSEHCWMEMKIMCNCWWSLHNRESKTLTQRSELFCVWNDVSGFLMRSMSMLRSIDEHSSGWYWICSHWLYPFKSKPARIDDPLNVNSVQFASDIFESKAAEYILRHTGQNGRHHNDYRWWPTISTTHPWINAVAQYYYNSNGQSAREWLVSGTKTNPWCVTAKTRLETVH